MSAKIIPKPETKPKQNSITIEILDDDHDDDDISLIYTTSSVGASPENPITVENYRKRKASSSSVRKLDFAPASSSRKSKTFTCEICTEERLLRMRFRVMGCEHVYCEQCVVSYVTSRLEGNSVEIRCPDVGCVGLLELDHCRSVLPPDLLDRWGSALCESTILDSQKFYCPFKDCSALLVADNDVTPASGPAAAALAAEVITQSECPYCRRLFCAQCKVPWHSEISCSEFQKLGKNEREKEDIMLMKLAQNKKWMRCSRCKFYVEKTAGCLFMTCRCGHKFCYTCGSPPTLDHYCAKCKH